MELIYQSCLSVLETMSVKKSVTFHCFATVALKSSVIT